MFCGKCGKKIEDGAKFCPGCGATCGGEPAKAESGESSPKPAGGGIQFGSAIGKLKDVSAFLSLDGKATRSEYWTTFLLVVLPLGLVGAICNIVCLVMNPFTASGNVGAVSVGASLLYWLGATLTGLSYIAFFPVMARRMRDVGLTPWIAVAYLGVLILPFYIGTLAGVFFIVAGCLPSKANAAETKTSKFVWPAATMLAIAYVATLALGTIVPSMMNQTNKGVKTLEKAMSHHYRY